MKRQVGARLQRVDLDELGRIVLEFYGAAGRELFVLDCKTRQIRPLERRPERSGAIPGAQKLLRKELTQARLTEISEPQPLVTLLQFEHKGGSKRLLIFERSTFVGRTVLCAQKAERRRVLAVFGHRQVRDGRTLKKNAVYVLPPALESETEEKAHSLSESERLPQPSPSRPQPPSTPLLRRLKVEQQKLKRLVRARVNDQKKHAHAAALYSEGELLKSNLHLVKRGQAHVDIDSSEGTVRVELAPRLSPQENLRDIFRRAKRGRRAADAIEEKLNEARGLLAAAEKHLNGIAADESNAEHEVAAELFLAKRASRPAAIRRKNNGTSRRPYRAFKCSDGSPIFVGRSAKDNDTLTFRIANGNDIWLHARGVAGSHTIIKLRLESIGTERLLDAAHLALHFSRARGDSQADITYCERKHVRKAGKGSPPGQVLLHQERVLHVRLEDARLMRLLATEF